jgi:hypothetical protein
MKKAAKTEPVKIDPHNIRPRVMNQVSVLLTQLETGEHTTMRERVQALVAISRIEQIYFMLAMKEKPPDDRSGSTVKKYATAFSADAISRRKTGTGPDDTEPDDWFERADIDTDDPE